MCCKIPSTSRHENVKIFPFFCSILATKSKFETELLPFNQLDTKTSKPNYNVFQSILMFAYDCQIKQDLLWGTPFTLRLPAKTSVIGVYFRSNKLVTIIAQNFSPSKQRVK